MPAGVQNSVGAMNQANRQADSSLQLVADTESALTRIDQGSSGVAGEVQAISDALREQDAAIRQVAISIEEIARIAERNQAAAVANNSTAGELDMLAGDLRASVARFKT